MTLQQVKGKSSPPTSKPRNNFSKRGFTLIELLVVFTVIAIVSTVTVASFVSYNKKSSLKQAASDVASLLRDAKSRTQSQIKPSSCPGVLDGYQVTICGLTNSTCDTANTYRLSVVCSGTATLITTRTLPKNINFSNTGTTSVTFLFKVLSNGVTGVGTIALTGYGSDAATVSVGSGGTLSVE